ncbi:PIN domain-containing protein [Candidatus Micrarchaeota archaeon]|nr:PIN domain-containing protein [Candidatus Micrarchaeota archaeon]
MNIRYIADTYAWIAYFNKKRFQKFIENEIIETPTIVIAEIIRTFTRKKVNQDAITKLLEFIKRRGLILELDLDTSIKGGKLAETESLSLNDALIYAYLTDDSCKLLTGDEHFKHKRNVIFEKE